ncbi:MAG: hypothetical protein K1060chlam2_00844 [Chlamydiae bacterium]|nr:hypothetical protein [Chlamydiota bacterium]
MSNLEASHEQLQEVLREEIAQRQAILSNLSQQEYVLLIGDLALKEELCDQNTKLVHRLTMIIRERGAITRQLLDLLPQGNSGPTLEELLDPLQEVEAETLLLFHTVRALVEKIHNEHLRTKTLYEMIEREGSLSVNNRAIRAQLLSPQEGKRPPLITIDYPEESENG